MTPDELAPIPPLAGVPDDLRAQLLLRCRSRGLARGEVVFSQDEPSETAYFVLSGRVRLVQHTMEGADVTMGIFAPFDPVGLLVALAGAPYPGTCEAVDQSSVLCIPASSIVRLMSQHPPLMLRVIRCCTDG